MAEGDQPQEQGELTPIEFGGKIIAAKRKCSCGGDVALQPDPEGNGRLAVCKRCGASLKIGDTA